MRERFLVLDGLRGLAALAVFAFHFDARPHWLAGSGHLAVDFFFVLSGFVLAHAYEERLKAPGAIGRFIRDRVIRLHPLLVLSLVPAAVLVALPPRTDPRSFSAADLSRLGGALACILARVSDLPLSL